MGGGVGNLEKNIQGQVSCVFINYENNFKWNWKNKSIKYFYINSNSKNEFKMYSF